MAEQQHIIRQHVLELEFTGENDTEAIQQEVITLFNKAVLPMLDRFFSAYSNAHEIDQIARLELDLGEISPAHLEMEFLNKLADALDDQLEQLCGKSTLSDDPDVLAAQLGLTPSAFNSDASGNKIDDLTAFFAKYSPDESIQSENVDSNSHGTHLPEIDEAEAQKRRNDLIRFFEQQSQLDEFTDDEDELDDLEEEEVDELGPIRVEINYQSPDDAHSELISALQNETVDESIDELTLPTDQVVTEQLLQSNRNLVLYFLQTGLFPWWAKSNKKNQLEQAVTELIQHQPDVFRADLHAWLQHKAVVKRLVATFSDEYLTKLITLFLPPNQHIKETEQLLGILTRQSFISERNRFLVWEELFQEIQVFSQGLVAVPERWIHVVYQVTETIFNPSVQSVIRGQLLATIASLFQLGERDNNWLKLKQLVERFEADSTTQWWFSENQSKSNEEETFTHVLEDSTQQKELNNLIDLVQQLQQTSTIQQAKDNRTEDQSTIVAPVPLAIDPFSESEKLYVRNAGIVLLWPFLERYLEKNELMVNGDFIHQEAREQACWLLQQLVIGPDTELFEPHLALPKVLVGMQPETPVNAPEVITNEQQLLMDELLTAVMEHVPAWKNLTVANLRKAYLQREGALSARDGQWLLQVKRETYDILLDKLPWPIQLIRLPWLDHLLVVEW